MLNTATTLPMREDVNIGALFDVDRDLDEPIKRRIFLTLVCSRRHPLATPDELNRAFHITQSAKDVARYLGYLSILDRKLKPAFGDVDFTSTWQVILRTPDWMKYGSVFEMYNDLKKL